jgi:hypothetical protein
MILGIPGPRLRGAGLPAVLGLERHNKQDYILFDRRITQYADHLVCGRMIDKSACVVRVAV